MPKECFYKSKIGILKIVTDHNTLICVEKVEQLPDVVINDDFHKRVISELEEYFDGKRQNFDIKLRPSGTNFCKSVWKELTKIPFGQTKSYKKIAQLIGRANAQRAVGQACNKNPILIFIPCHRVISSSGNLTGFACGLEIKRFLLNHEK